MGYHFLLQGLFPTQGLNPSLLPWQVILLPLSQLGSRGEVELVPNYCWASAGVQTVRYACVQTTPVGGQDALVSAALMACTPSGGGRCCWS